MRTAWLLLSLIACSSLGLAQDAPGGWRRIDVQTPATPDEPQQPAPENPAPAPDVRSGLPAKLTIQPGTFVTVRVNEWLSSDRNDAGDAFSATLAKPIVVDGFVVAHRGQTVGGRVVEVQRAGRGEPVSRLDLQITELTVADGQQVPVETQLVSRTLPSMRGRDAETIIGTTVAGAAIGGVAGRGIGAAVGALAGASAGALLTRNRPTVIYPETALTFRLDVPVTVSTERAPQAFHQADQNDYERDYDRYEDRGYARRLPPPPPPCYYCAPYPYYGPRIAFFYGPHFYWGPRFHYRPFIW